MTLLKRLKAHIRAHGVMTIADYMEAALLDPEGGYYTTKAPFGAEGDFTTAPEISQIFGELIGAWLAQAWLRMGSPSPVCLAELGPGRGTLMADMLRATQGVPGFHHALSIVMIEASAGLAAKQRQLLSDRHPRIRWEQRLESLPDLPLLLIANEWFDALPIRQFVWRGKGWHERMIGLEGEKFCFTERACHPSEGQDPLSPLAQADAWIPACAAMTKETVGMTKEICQPALDAMQIIASHIARHGGAALIIDYGYAHGETGDTLQAVRRHAYADPLEEPGSADITAHVDFLALRTAALAAGAAVHGAAAQGAFLKRLGAELRAAQLARVNPSRAESILSGLERLVSPQGMGELFKAMAVTHAGMEPVEGF